MARLYVKTLMPVLVVILALGTIQSAQAVMLVSRADTVKVGKQVEAQVIQEYGGLSTDARLNNRVSRVGNTVAAKSPRQDIDYTFKVLNSDQINAFAAPGGPVLITKRLASMLTDSELAFVLAHEAGHVTGEHGRQAINQSLLAQGVFGLLFGGSSQATQIGVNVLYTLYNRGYSRSQEYQADSYGLQFMQQAGYSGEGAVTALAKLGMRKTSGINKYLSTHPDVPDRIGRIGQSAGISSQRQQELIRSVQ